MRHLPELAERPVAPISPQSFCNQLEAHRLKEGRLSTAAVRAFFLGFLAREPSIEEHKALAYSSRFQSVEGLVSKYLATGEHRRLLKAGATFRLVETDPQSLYVDLSHTVFYAHLSGIQRVVRSLVQGLVDGQRPCKFFVFRNDDARPSFLTDVEAKKFFSFEKGFGKKAGFLSRILKAVSKIPFYARRIYRELFHPLFEVTRLALRVLINPSRWPGDLIEKRMLVMKRWIEERWVYEPVFEAPNRSPDPSSPLEIEIPFFDSRSQILIPELAIDRARIEFYLSFKHTHSNASLGLLLYDLIPLLHPEFVTLHEGYLTYLRLFRVIDRVSCISEAVANQVRSLTQMLGVSDRVLVQAHELAGALSPTEGAHSSAHANEGPFVLVVGTVEIRKNSLNVLRAALSLMDQGLQFRMIFAGNPGWMAERFLHELFKAKAQGRPVELRLSVPEAELKGLYQNCLFTVFASHAEGFGLPIVESLRFKKPVVVSNNGCMRDLALRLGGCVLVEAADFKSIAQGMRTLLSDAAARQLCVDSIRPTEWPTWSAYADEVFKFVYRAPRLAHS